MNIQMQSMSYLSQFTAINGGIKQNQTTYAASALKTSNSTAVAATVEVTVTDEVKERTVEDVKNEFYDYLGSLQISRGLGNTHINVTVSEAAFERMLDDPEYMQRMMDLCKRDMCDPAWNTHPIETPYMHINITDNTNNQFNSEYVASTYGGDGYGSNFESETANSFWSKKSDKSDESKKIREKRQEEKEMLEFLVERAQQRKEMLNASWESLPLPNNGFAYDDNGHEQPAASAFAEA